MGLKGPVRKGFEALVPFRGTAFSKALHRTDDWLDAWKSAPHVPQLGCRRTGQLKPEFAICSQQIPRRSTCHFRAFQAQQVTRSEASKLLYLELKLCEYILYWNLDVHRMLCYEKNSG